MVERILVLVLARGNDAECAAWVGRGQDPRLACGVAGRLKHDVFAVARASHGDIEALVVFLKDQRGFGKFPGSAAVKLVLPLLLLVLHGVEERAIVGGPHHGAHALHFIS